MSNLSSNTDNRSSEVVAANVCGIVITTLAILLRFWSRVISKAPLSWDDWFALAAVPFAYAECALLFSAIDHGLGQHLQHFLATGGHTSTGVGTVKINVIYTAGITLVKISALVMYGRIFGTVKPFKIAIIVTAVSAVLWMVITILLVIFSCSPSKHIGIFPNLTHGDQCLDNRAVYLGTAIANVVIDIVILVLPHFQLWKLQMGSHRKLRLAFIFLFGYGIVMVSLVRMIETLILDQRRSPDTTWYNVPISITYGIEIPIGVFTISLPAIVQLVRRWHKSGFVSLFKRHDYTAAVSRQVTPYYISSHSKSGHTANLELREGFHRLHSDT